MIEIERFFGGVLKDEEKPIEFESDIVLLSGPNHCGKTSLLFQYGYTYAKEGYSVLFICNKKKFLNSLPSFPDGFKKDDFILNKIKIKYIENDNDLRNYIMDFPLIEFLPDLILIDDLSFYFGHTVYERNTILGKTVSFIKETITYIKRKKSSIYNCNNNCLDKRLLNCNVIISDSSTTHTTATTTSINDNITSTINNTQGGTILSSGHPKFLYILQRWINLVIIINEVQQQQTQQITTTTNSNINTNININNTTSTTNNQQQQQQQQPKLPSFNNFNLSILKYNNNNNYKDYILNYTLKFFGTNNQNNSYVLENMQNLVLEK